MKDTENLIDRLSYTIRPEDVPGVKWPAHWGNGQLQCFADLERPCIYIGAPDFRPEPVASRAIALSAGRGAFQTLSLLVRHPQSARTGKIQRPARQGDRY